MGEIAFLLLLGAGFVGLALKRRTSESRSRRIGQTFGGVFSRTGIPRPDDFQRTALYSIADGGNESHVLASTAMAGPHNVAVTTFEFEFGRSIRGAWGFLRSRPAFRLYGPCTVVAVELPFERPHVVIKREGSADLVVDDPRDIARSVAAAAREVLGADRHEPAACPADISPDAVAFPGLERHRVYAKDAHVATTVLDDTMVGLLRSTIARKDEIVIEICGHLLLLYRASDAVLPAHTLLAYRQFALDLTASLSPLGESPRGVGHHA